MSRRRLLAAELDDGHWLRVIASNVGVRGAGRQRVRPRWRRASAERWKRRYRADARRAVVTPALRTGLVRSSWRRYRSAILSAALLGVFGAEVGALA